MNELYPPTGFGTRCLSRASTFTIAVLTFLAITLAGSSSVYAQVEMALTVNCPGKMQLPATAGTCAAVASYSVTTTGSPVLTYTFSGATTGTGSGTGSGSAFNVGTTIVKVTGISQDGVASCDFEIVVSDIEPPVITCPADIVVCGSQVVNYTIPSATDNCGSIQQTLNLSQSASDIVDPSMNISCNNGVTHTKNSYWRVYDLAALNLNGPYTVNKVVFGVHSAVAASGVQPVVVRVHTLSGPFLLSNLTLIASKAVMVTNQSGTLISVVLADPPTVAADAKLVLEINTPDGRSSQNMFYIGANGSAETGSSFISAADCGITEPMTFANIGNPGMSIILNAEGTSGSGPLQSVMTAGLASGSTFPVGTTVNTYQATDASGNTSTCSFNVTVNPIAVADEVENQKVCNGAVTIPVTFSSSATGGNIVYNWTNDNASIGLAENGTGDLPSFTGTNTGNEPVTATITVTPVYTNAGTTCTGTPGSFTITVNPTPVVSKVADQVVCAGGETAAILFNTTTTGATISYNWVNSNSAIGLAADGAGNIASFTATNTSDAPITATITATAVSNSGGLSAIDSFTYTGALQTFTVPAGITSLKIRAAGAQGGTVTDNGGPFEGGKGAIMSGTFAVTPGQVLDLVVGAKGNSNPSTSGGGGGTGVNNSGTAWIVAGGGAGIDFQQPGYVNMDATIASQGRPGSSGGGAGGMNGGKGGDVSLGANISRGGNGWNTGNTGSFGLNGASSVTTFTNGTWGLGGGGGSVGYGSCNCGAGGGGYSGGGSGMYNSSGGGGGSINTGTDQLNTGGSNRGNGYIVIEYKSSEEPLTCDGTSTTFTITVNPTPSVNELNDQTVCNATNIAVVSITGPVKGTVYNWTNNNTSVGLAASGTGDIPAFVATNDGNGRVTATITVTPSYSNGGLTCEGIAKTFSFTVNPTATVNKMEDIIVCNTATTEPLKFASDVSRSAITYNWTNDDASIGLAAEGTGSLPSFTAVNDGSEAVTATITVTPSYGNGEAACSGTPQTFTITVNPKPNISCASNIDVSNDPGVCGALVNYAPAVATGSPEPVITYSTPSGSVFPVGTTTVTATATSACGIATCSFTVTVNDEELPVINCPSSVTYVSDPESCSTIIPVHDAIVSDNCMVTGLSWVMTGATNGSSATTGINQLGEALFNTGVTSVQYTVTDAAGNSSTCSFTVTVGDARQPVIENQPASTAVCKGGVTTLGITVSNAVSYQWQAMSGNEWVNVPGANASTLQVSGDATGDHLYKVVITGKCSIISSATAIVHVNALPAVSLSASGTTSLLPNQKVTVRAVVQPAGGSYLWYKNEQILAGRTGSELTDLSIDDQGAYKLLYTDLQGCVSTSAEMSINAAASARLFVYPNPNVGRFKVRFYNNPNDKISVNVYDSRGNTVYSKTVAGTNAYTGVDVDITKHGAGVYLVETRNGAGKQVGAEKIIVVR